ncbi:MAG: DUF3426 domain-containing protein [Steroidobacteraceae bacterium]
MLTQCPGCQTVFRVTSTILRAAHGQVRCGRCNTQFDAIEHLMDGDDTIAEESNISGTAVNETITNPEFEETSLAHEDIVLEGTRIEISGIYRRVDEDAAEPPHSRTVIEEFNIDTEEWENPFDKTPDAEAAAEESDETELEDVEEVISENRLADALASLDLSAEPEAAARTGAVNSDYANRHEASPATSPDVADDPAASMLDAANEVEDEPRIAAEPRAPFELPEQPFALAKPRWPWAVASVLLGLLLSAQALHHARANLARHPTFGPQLTKLYAAIGQPLTPEWQVQAYSIKQWGMVADPQQPGTLRLHASVTNGATFAQPYPLLQLNLEDRFGTAVGIREFKPEEYLTNRAQATRLLAAGEAASIDLEIVDPGPDAAGFQFDTCLQIDAALQCTKDTATPAS